WLTLLAGLIDGVKFCPIAPEGLRYRDFETRTSSTALGARETTGVMRTARRTRERTLHVARLNEVQLVPVQIADAELPRAVEHVLDVLRELDPPGVCLTRERRVRRAELPRLEPLVNRVDFVGVEPEAHLVPLRLLAVHVQHHLGLPERHHPEVHQPVVFVAGDLLEAERRVPVERAR